MFERGPHHMRPPLQFEKDEWKRPMAHLTSATGPQGGTPKTQNWGREEQATVALACPMIITNLIELALTTNNLVLVGELGAHALASVTLANNLFFFFAISGLGV